MTNTSGSPTMARKFTVGKNECHTEIDMDENQLTEDENHKRQPLKRQTNGYQGNY